MADENGGIVGENVTTFILIVAICVVPIAFAYAERHVPLRKAFVSPFWWFTVYWLLSYPIRAVWMDKNVIETIRGGALRSDELGIAASSSLLLWVVAYLGYTSVSYAATWRSFSRYLGNDLNYGRIGAVVLFSLAAGIVFIGGSSWQDGLDALGSVQNELRHGSGPYFFLSSMYLYTVITWVAGYLQYNEIGKGRVGYGYWVLGGLVLLLGALMMLVLSSRRYLAIPIMAMVVGVAIKRRWPWWVVAPLPLAPVLAMPVLQVVRYIDLDKGVSLQNFSPLVDLGTFATALSSTFEGVEHLAAYIKQASPSQLLFGVDGGLSWLFNSGLALIPRALWTTKPDLYGSVFQQYFIYPSDFYGTVTPTTLPPGFVVDFWFGYGVVGGVILAFFAGRLMGVAGAALSGENVPFAVRALALYGLVYAFNFVRGGSGVLQGVLVLCVVVALSVGLRHSLLALILYFKNIVIFWPAKR